LPPNPSAATIFQVVSYNSRNRGTRATGDGSPRPWCSSSSSGPRCHLLSSVNTRGATCDVIAARPRTAKIWPIAKSGTPSPRTGLTSRRRQRSSSRPCLISRYRLFEKIMTPKEGAWSRTSVTGRTITASGTMRCVLHVVDLNTAHDVQWPLLLEAITDRADPPDVRITDVRTDRDMLHQLGTTFTSGLAGRSWRTGR
jgi:hypothetical protein